MSLINQQIFTNFVHLNTVQIHLVCILIGNVTRIYQVMKNIQFRVNHWIPITRKNKKNLLETDFTKHTDLLIPHIRAALVNSRSIRNKVPMIIEFLNDFKIDILIITETWLSHKDCPLLFSLNIDPYSLSFTAIIRNARRRTWHFIQVISTYFTTN